MFVYPLRFDLDQCAARNVRVQKRAALSREPRMGKVDVAWSSQILPRLTTTASFGVSATQSEVSLGAVMVKGRTYHQLGRYLTYWG